MIIKVGERKRGSPSNTNCALAVQRKYRKRRNEIRQREYRKLKSVLPAIAHRDRVTKVTVIEEAIRYIDQLHDTLAQRLKAGENISIPEFNLRQPLVTATSSECNIPSATTAVCPRSQNRSIFYPSFKDNIENENSLT